MSEMAVTLPKAFEAYKGQRIVVAMSGGVDSSLAAAMLHLAGAEVIGVHMRVWHYGDCADDLNAKIGTCCTPADANDARRVAEQFGFAYHAMDFEADFRRAVIDPFVGDYLAGRTPNPCVNCNTKLKLGTLLGKARAYGAVGVATGHYARVVHPADGRAELLRAADSEKDQSYYLFGLQQPQLRQFHMPLGEMTKAETRQMAREVGLHLADKPDSQDICFVSDGDYRRFLLNDAGLNEDALAGAVVDTAGRIVGRHNGIHNFTIGQRKGLGLGGGEVRYVVDILPETRTVVVGNEEDIYASALSGSGLNWVGIEPTTEPVRVRAKIRYRHEPEAATLIPGEGDSFRMEFDEPQRAITPGQAVVCYDEATAMSVVAGGWILVREMASRFEHTQT